MNDEQRSELERIMQRAVLDDNDRHHLLKLIANIEKTARADLVHPVFDKPNLP
jgi:hypothetical protein